MNKSTHSPSDSGDSDSPHSPLANNNTTSSSSKPRPPKYHTNIKTKLLSLKNKNPMKRNSPNSSPIKTPSSSIFHATSINPTHPPYTEDCSPPLQIIILTFHLIIIFPYNIPNYLHYLLPLIFIIPLFLMTLIVITLLLIPPFILSGNLLKFTLLLHHQLKLMTFR